MPNPTTFHVVHNSERRGWDVKRGGSIRASGHYRTKQEAIDAGRIMSRREGGELIIHNKDGKIGRRDGHGNDPFPPRVELGTFSGIIFSFSFESSILF